MAVRIFKDTTAPSLTDSITVNGAAFDLTTSTVKFRMRAVGSSTLKVDAAATVVTAASGDVRYDWVSADVDTAGDYLGWWRVTLPSGRIQETTEFEVEVADHAPTATPALCTVADVRQWMQTPPGDITDDRLIEVLINRASRAIRQYTSREFTLETGTNPRTRTVDVGGYHRLATREGVPVGDMASAPGTVRVLDSDGGTVSTLTVSTDLVALPTHRESWEPVTHLRFRPDAQTLAEDYQLEVTGSFGWPSVPEDITHACVLAVATWLRRGVQAFGTSYQPEDAAITGPESLPTGVRAMLAQYRRIPVA